MKRDRPDMNSNRQATMRPGSGENNSQNNKEEQAIEVGVYRVSRVGDTVRFDATKPNTGLGVSTNLEVDVSRLRRLRRCTLMDIVNQIYIGWSAKIVDITTKMKNGTQEFTERQVEQALSLANQKVFAVHGGNDRLLVLRTFLLHLRDTRPCSGIIENYEFAETEERVTIDSGVAFASSCRRVIIKGRKNHERCNQCGFTNTKLHSYLRRNTKKMNTPTVTTPLKYTKNTMLTVEERLKKAEKMIKEKNNELRRLKRRSIEQQCSAFTKLEDRKQDRIEHTPSQRVCKDIIRDFNEANWRTKENKMAGMRWSRGTKQFATKIYLKSQALYLTLGNDIPLPSLQTTRSFIKRYCTGDIRPSVRELRQFKQRLSNAIDDKKTTKFAVSMAIDAMVVSEKVVLCSKTGDVVGAIDDQLTAAWDSRIETPDHLSSIIITSLADPTQTFCVSELFSKGDPDEFEMEFHITHAIAALAEAGITVDVVVMDYASKNRAWMKLNNITHDKPEWVTPVSTNSILVIPDGPHLVKRMRNQLYKRSLRLSTNGDAFGWNTIRFIHRLQDEAARKGKLERLYKLGVDAVDLDSSNKMRVKSAMRIFSDEMCTYVSTHKGKAISRDFITFLKRSASVVKAIMDKRTPWESAKPERLVKMEDDVKFFQRWRKSVHEDLRYTNDTIGHFQQHAYVIRALLRRYPRDGIKYGFVNQDAVECRFSCMRSASNTSDHPTPYEVKSNAAKIDAAQLMVKGTGSTRTNISVHQDMCELDTPPKAVARHTTQGTTPERVLEQVESSRSSRRTLQFGDAFETRHKDIINDTRSIKRQHSNTTLKVEQTLVEFRDNVARFVDAVAHQLVPRLDDLNCTGIDIQDVVRRVLDTLSAEQCTTRGHGIRAVLRDLKGRGQKQQLVSIEATSLIVRVCSHVERWDQLAAATTLMDGSTIDPMFPSDLATVYGQIGFVPHQLYKRSRHHFFDEATKAAAVQIYDCLVTSDQERLTVSSILSHSDHVHPLVVIPHRCTISTQVELETYKTCASTRFFAVALSVDAVIRYVCKRFLPLTGYEEQKCIEFTLNQTRIHWKRLLGALYDQNVVVSMIKSMWRTRRRGLLNRINDATSSDKKTVRTRLRAKRKNRTQLTCDVSAIINLIKRIVQVGSTEDPLTLHYYLVGLLEHLEDDDESSHDSDDDADENDNPTVSNSRMVSAFAKLPPMRLLGLADAYGVATLYTKAKQKIYRVGLAERLEYVIRQKQCTDPETLNLDFEKLGFTITEAIKSNFADHHLLDILPIAILCNPQRTRWELGNMNKMTQVLYIMGLGLENLDNPKLPRKTILDNMFTAIETVVAEAVEHGTFEDVVHTEHLASLRTAFLPKRTK